MENKNIIIILLVVIVILAAAIGFLLLNPANAQESTKVKITSDKTQYEDDAKLSIQLSDLNNTAVSDEIVNVTVTDSKGKVVVDDVVKTNSKGKAKLDLDLKKGKYAVNVTYGGNENYTGNSTTQKLTVKKEIAATKEVSSTSSSSTMYNGRDLSGGSGESVVVENVDEESGVIEGYKGGRKGIWTPSGNFIEEGGGY